MTRSPSKHYKLEITSAKAVVLRVCFAMLKDCNSQVRETVYGSAVKNRQKITLTITIFCQ